MYVHGYIHTYTRREGKSSFFLLLTWQCSLRLNLRKNPQSFASSERRRLLNYECRATEKKINRSGGCAG